MDKPEIVQEDRPKKKRLWLVVTFVFIGILLFIVYTSFYNPELGRKITGNVVSSGDVEVENSIRIDADLSIENLNVNSYMDKFSFRIKNSGTLTIGKEILHLSDKASVVIDSYSGKIDINLDNLDEIKGEGIRVFVDGLPISGISGSEIKISSSEAIDYSYLKLENVYLDSLSFLTSGIVRINEDKLVLRLEEENFKIKKFKGDLEISRGSLELKGILDKSNLKNFIGEDSFNSKLEEQLDDNAKDKNQTD